MNIMKKILSTILLLFVQFIMFSQTNNNEQPYYFVQITDPQFGFISNNNDFEKETEIYTSAIEKINKLSPAFVVITGDFVNDPKDSLQIKEFKRLNKLFRSDIPVYLSPGNHDLGQDPVKQDFKYYFYNYGKGNDRFSFKYKNSTFIGFNSVIIKSEKNNRREKKQLRWLKRELKKAYNSHNTILFTHYPFFIKDFNEEVNYSNQSLEKRSKYFSLFEKYGVDVIMSGHLHKNAYSEYNNIQNIITSAVGKQLGDDLPGIRIIKVDKNIIEHYYYDLDNIPTHIQ